MLAVLLCRLRVEVGADEGNDCAELRLVRQLIAEEHDGRADDAHALDDIADAVRDRRHARQRVERELIVPAQEYDATVILLISIQMEVGLHVSGKTDLGAEMLTHML